MAGAMTDPKVLRAARIYVNQLGWPVVPVAKGTKKPLAKWRALQERLNTPEELQAMFSENGVNISAVTGAISGLVVLDADSEEGIAEIESYLPDGLITPICNTAHGKHYYFKHPGQPIKTGSLKPGHIDVRGDGGMIAVPPSEGKRWAIKPTDCMPADIPSKLLEVLTQYSLNKSSSLYTENVTNGGLVFTQGGRDNSLFHVARWLRQGGANEDEARQVIELLGKSCEPPMPAVDCFQKVESTYRHEIRTCDNIAEALRLQLLVTPGRFKVTDCYTELGLVTSSNKAACRVALGRMVDEGLLRRTGDRGIYEVIDKTYNDLDWQNAPDLDPLDIRWPLNLQDKVNIYPGNLVLMAGETNVGKTAFMISFAYLNKDRHDIFYWASSDESDESTLKMRIGLLGDPGADWSRFHARKRTHSFHDVIEPDAINLIDYISPYEKPWMIAKDLEEISEKIRNGVVIVAVQKDPKKERGVGAEFTQFKPAFSFNLIRGNVKEHQPHKLEPTKVKNARYPDLIKEAYQVIQFKLVNGCKFMKVA
jgi:hypothetical protein